MGKKRQPPSDDEDDDEEEELNLEEFEESEEEEYDSDVRISSDFFFSFARPRVSPRTERMQSSQSSRHCSLCLSLFFLCVFTPQPVRSLPLPLFHSRIVCASRLSEY